jgi:uncharacterized membrane protein
MKMSEKLQTTAALLYVLGAIAMIVAALHAGGPLLFCAGAVLVVLALSALKLANHMEQSNDF